MNSHAIVNTAIVYIVMIIGLRTIGRRQVCQLTPFDLLVMLLLGSAVETAMVGPSGAPDALGFHNADTTFLTGILSAGTLLIINFVLSRVLNKNKNLRHLVNGGPLILVKDGKFVDENIKRVGLSHDEIMQAIRYRGYAELKDAKLAVLEPNGEIDVIAA